MTYSLTRFSVYEEARKSIASGERNPSGLKLALCGGIGPCRTPKVSCWSQIDATFDSSAGAMGGIVGNPADIILVRMQADDAKPPAKRLHYKHCFDGLSRVSILRNLIQYAHAQKWTRSK